MGEIPKNYRFVELYNDNKSLTIKISLSTYPNCIRQTKDLLFIDKMFVSYKNEYIIIDMFDPTKYYNDKSETIMTIPKIFTILNYNEMTNINTIHHEMIRKKFKETKEKYTKLKFDLKYILFETDEYGLVI